jgi:hypothetical protein
MTRTPSGESAARFAAHELAVPDDDDSPGSASLDGEFSTAGFLAGGCGSPDDDESAADFGMDHGGPCSGEGRRGVGSIQIATSGVKKQPAWLVGEGHVPQETLPQRRAGGAMKRLVSTWTAALRLIGGAKSTGLAVWKSTPASFERRRSSCWPHPV